MKAIVTSATSIKLEWEEPKNPNGIINGYNIYYDQLIQNISAYITVVGTKTYHEFQNMAENRTYYFWITAKTEIGEGTSTPIINQSTSGGICSLIPSVCSFVHSFIYNTEARTGNAILFTCFIHEMTCTIRGNV